MIRPFFLPLFLVFPLALTGAPVRITVWDEQQPEQKQAYDNRFLGEVLAEQLQGRTGLAVRIARQADPEQGWSDALLDETDVLILWAHRRVKQQEDARAEAIVQRVLDGRLSLIALHSAHWAKPFVRLMQERAKADARDAHPGIEPSRWIFTNTAPIYSMIKANARLTPYVEPAADGAMVLTLPHCVFPRWRNDGAPSRVTTLLPEHPIASGLPVSWTIPQTEMYSEPFHVPPPDAVIFEERWEKGEHFRSGCLWQVGRGQVFYFRPGHETYPIYRQEEPVRVIENAARWLAAHSPLASG